jgi:hypothetical protein
MPRDKREFNTISNTQYAREHSIYSKESGFNLTKFSSF